jgi:hypothetical protein
MRVMRAFLPDREVAMLAAVQEGVVATAQLRSAGLGPGAVRWRVREGRLHPYCRGVYIVGVPRITPRGRLWAVVLATKGTLSHRTAAQLWDLVPQRRGPIHVIARGKSRPGITVHDCVLLDAVDTTTLHRLPVTTPARTLHDLAAANDRDLKEAVHRAEALQLHAPVRPGAPGAARLRAVAPKGDPQITRRELERRMLALIDRAGLPAPLVNAPVGAYVADFLWPAQRVIVETDSRAWHLDRFEADRARDVDLTIAGYRVLRFTWRQVVEEPEAVARRLRAVLDS